MLQEDHDVRELAGQAAFRESVHRVVRETVRDRPLRPDEQGFPSHPAADQTVTSSAKSQLSRFCCTRARNRVAISPSIVRWSHDIEMFTIERIAIVSSITTGRFWIASRDRIAVLGWLMIGRLAIEPYGPGFVIVNVEAWTSSGLSW